MRFQFFIVGFFAVVSILAPGASRDQDLDQLVARQKSAPVDQQPRLCTQIAELLLKSANQLYSDDKVEAARADVSEVVSYSDKASDAAIQSGKHLKDTEIAMRRMADKLRDIKRKLVFEDQGPVQSAADHLETLRTNLLNHMFEGQK